MDMNLKAFQAIAARAAKRLERDEAMFEAARRGDAELAIALRSQGSSLNARDARGMRPIDIAAANGWAPCVERLHAEMLSRDEYDACPVDKRWSFAALASQEEALLLAHLWVRDQDDGPSATAARHVLYGFAQSAALESKGHCGWASLAAMLELSGEEAIRSVLERFNPFAGAALEAAEATGARIVQMLREQGLSKLAWAMAAESCELERASIAKALGRSADGSESAEPRRRRSGSL